MHNNIYMYTLHSQLLNSIFIDTLHEDIRMADRFRGHERRFSDAGACSHPSADSLVGKLNELDIRLRQLEEKQSPLESYFAADLRRAAAINGQHHHHCKSLSSTLDDVRVKGTLMDRLHLLETRIHQLSSELDKDGHNIESSSVNNISVEMKSKKQGNSSTDISSSRVAGDIFNRGSTHKLQCHRSKPKDKEGIDAKEKRTSATCRNEKRRMERAKIYKRWFPVGC